MNNGAVLRGCLAERLTESDQIKRFIFNRQKGCQQSKAVDCRSNNSAVPAAYLLNVFEEFGGRAGRSADL